MNVDFYKMMHDGKNNIYRRISIWNETKKLCLTNYPIIKPSIKYTFSAENIPIIEKKYTNTMITVESIDTIDAGIRELENGTKPLLLNLADDCLPGGCVDNGSGAQEESLFRRSNYFLSLDRKLYPLFANDCIYSPAITVFRKSEANNWQIYDKYYKLDFIACPGIKYPVIEYQNGMKKLNNNDVAILKNKIRHIIHIAYIHNHDVVILGAMGCGAWKNPSHHVAEIFREILSEFDGCFSKIVFAILKNAGDIETKFKNIDNYDIFKSILS
jgi:uncharacterized protein (TIGR02452 family)